MVIALALQFIDDLDSLKLHIESTEKKIKQYAYHLNETIDEKEEEDKNKERGEIIITTDISREISKSRDTLFEPQLPYLISAAPPSGFASRMKKVSSWQKKKE